ncbi:phosphotransferase [Agaribacter marinus]|nr:phosphotransferase [Agaribacter marinus]
MMDVYEYFGLSRDVGSIYKYAPVFQHVIDGKKVIIKKTKEQIDRLAPLINWQKKLSENGINTIHPLRFNDKLIHSIDDENWVVYPFIEGDRYQSTQEQIYTAGELLGRVHSTSDSVFKHGFSWEDYDEEFYDEILDDIEKISLRYPREFNSEAGKKLFDNVKSLASNKFDCLKTRELPTSDCTWDFKASNLIYQPKTLYLIDTDNAGKVPRIFDLALALLLFHTTEDTAPNRIFTVDEWKLFLSGYKKHVELTDIEKRYWQNMLLFVYTDEVSWAINDIEDDESNRQKTFVKSLVTFNFSQYLIE